MVIPWRVYDNELKEKDLKKKEDDEERREEEKISKKNEKEAIIYCFKVYVGRSIEPVLFTITK